jgi:hypothetical protein
VINEEAAYVLGVLITDGSTSIKKTWYRVRLQMTDYDIIESIAKLLAPEKKLYFSKAKNAWSLEISSPWLYHDLEALGCTVNKTETVGYPLISPELDRHYIRGAIDGDGSWRLISGRLRLKFCGNDLHVWGFYDRIRYHLGIEPHNIHYPPQQLMKNFCEIEYNTTDSIKIREWIYNEANYYCKRKHTMAYSHPATYLQRFGIEDLATLVGVGPASIRYAIKHHGLPTSSIGPYRYFEKEQLKVWLEYFENKAGESLVVDIQKLKHLLDDWDIVQIL